MQIGLDRETMYVKRMDPLFFLHVSRTTTPESFVDSLQCGDVIFSRSDTLFGSVIQFSGRCMWNHVAMCFEDPATGEKYWWECTNSNDATEKSLYGMPEDCAANFPTGARIFPLKNRLKWILSSGGGGRMLRFGVSRLQGMTPSERTAFSIRFASFVISESGKKYERTYWPLIMSWYDGWKSIRGLFGCSGSNAGDAGNYDEDEVSFGKQDLSSYFCSELMAETLRQCGLFRERPSSALWRSSGEWTVADLADERCLNFHLQEGLSFSPVTYVSVLLSVPSVRKNI